MSDQKSSLPIRTELDGDVVIKLGDGTTPSQYLKIDTQGRAGVKIDGKYDVAGNATPSSAGLIAHDRGASIDETDLNKRVTAVAGSNDTVCLDVAIRDEAGQAFSAANPMPMVIVETSGEEIHNYATGAAVAVDAESNHDYVTLAEHTFKQAWVSGSGKIKATLQVETAAASGVFTTLGVKFNSVSDTNIEFDLRVPRVVPVGAKIRVVRKNLDKAAQDVYSTIIGLE